MGLIINLAVLIEQPTGITNYIQGILPHLQGLSPTLLTARPRPDFPCHPIPQHLSPDEGTRGHLRRLLWTQLSLPALYRRLGADLLFSPVPEGPLFQGCRQVVMCHDLIPVRFPARFSPLGPYFRYYVPQVLRHSLHVICNSQATAEDIQRFYRIPEGKITPIPLAHDQDQFYNLGLPPQPYFVYLGRMVPYKNLHRLISAFASLPPDYSLRLAGPGDRRYLPLLQRQIRELDLQQRVEVLNYVPRAHLPQLLGQALALVFPSLWEGFGLPVLEAMACGTPVIASDIGALREVCGEAALLIDPLDPAAWAAAMGAIIHDSDLRSSLQAAGLARAKQFTWRATAQATAAVLAAYGRP